MLTTERVPAATESKSHLLVLHGLGDSMDGWRWLPGELRLPWLNYVLVNAPDEYFGGFSWYDFPGDGRPGIQRSRRLLFGLLDELEQEFLAENIGILGFSQGCLMTMDVGFRYPHRLAGLVGISGYVSEPDVLLRERSSTAVEQTALVTHGTRDPLIPIAQVRGQIELLKAAGLNIQWKEFNKVHTVEGPTELALIRSFLTSAFRHPTPTST
jgi:phospholipase/carboxylesterase